MHKHLRISLVIPAYNEERHLADCLEAALAQTVPFYEIIVVDNASTDDTAKVARRFKGVRVVHESQRGIAPARNAGFNAARGDIIARIDADTQLPRGWAAHIEAFYADPLHTRTAWTGSGAFIGVPMARLVNLTYRILAFHSNRLFIGHPTIWGSNMAFPVSMWQQVGADTCVQRGIHEDLDLAIHIARADMTVFFDKTMPVPARLRRIEGTRAELWDYLQWWPQTLRQHGYASWRICWAIGVPPLFLATPILNFGSLLRRRTAQLLNAFEV